MKFATPNCPECGKPMKGTCDNVPGIALMIEEDGDWQYEGETKMCWDSQHTESDDQGRWLLTCGSHEWYSDHDQDQV